MRILYFHQYFSTPNGKTGLRSYYFAKKLVNEGNKVFVICLNDIRTDCGLKGNFQNNIREGSVEGINIIQLNIKYSNTINFLNRGLIFIKYSLIGIILALKIKPNLIISTSTPLSVAIPGIILRWLKGIPFIFEVRDLWPSLPIAMGVLKNKLIISILRILENISYKSADAIIALSPGICEEILKKNIPKQKVHLIPNIADLNLFKCKSNFNKKNLEFLRKYDKKITNSSLIAAFTGAHGLANGLENMIEVAKELKNSNRDDIKILFIGEGKLKSNLINQANKYNLDNCIFLKPMSKKKLASFLNDSVDIGLMVLKDIPAFYNGTSPNKFFDYLACGLPVINNYPGWLSHMIKEQDLGFVLNPNENNAFAKKLIEIADNKNILFNLSKNCRVYAKNFDQKLLSNKFNLIAKKTYKKYHERKHFYFSRKIYEIFKSILDRLMALILIIVLSPLFILIAITVFINLGSPVFFIQERPGLNNKIFKLIKFRSMHELNSSYKKQEDHLRMNAFSKFFRSTSLDELPELINILKGDMSFVGPRPLLKEYLQLYSEEELKRHNVKPGITGYAQINGRNFIDWKEKFKLDLYYIKNRSLILDTKIIIITIFKVLNREGINSQNKVGSEKYKG